MSLLQLGHMCVAMGDCILGDILLADYIITDVWMGNTY